MIEFRALVRKESQQEVLPKISSLLTELNPALILKDQSLSRSILVWVRFPSTAQLEEFITAISLQDLEIEEWAIY
jgi:hypothetical protein